MAFSILSPLFKTLSSICIVLNIASLVILFRTKNLRQSRFNCLVLYLSISDTLIGVQTIASGVTFEFIRYDASAYVCTLIGSLMKATTIFSMYQVLLICLERLNATYTVPRKFLKMITSDGAVGTGFFVFHGYPIIIWIYQISKEKPICIILPSIVNLLSFDIPLITLTTATVVLYFVIMFRLLRHGKKVHALGVHQTGQNSTGISEIKRKVMTLGIIVLLSTVIIIPRSILSILDLVGGTAAVGNLPLSISTYILILNPILDPCIYVLRIKTFRQRLFCACTKTSVHPNNSQATSSMTDGNTRLTAVVATNSKHNERLSNSK